MADDLYSTAERIAAEMLRKKPRPAAPSPAPARSIEPAGDLYSALIGGGADGNQAISNALRRRRDIGQLGVLTGDKVLSQAGQDLTKSSDTFTDMLQQIRQDRQRQDQTKAYQDAQLGHMDRALQETERGNNLDFIASILGDKMRADRPSGSGRPPKLRLGEIKEMKDLAQTVGAIEGIEKFMDSGGTFGAVKVGDVPIPGGRTLANTAAALGYGTKESKASFQARQTWDLFYNIAERNRMFGATLTTNEKKSWDDANPGKNMTDEQIKSALPVMKKVFKHRLDSTTRALEAEGYNAEAIAEYANSPDLDLPTEVPGKEVMPPADTPAPKNAPKRIKVDLQGNIIGN